MMARSREVKKSSRATKSTKSVKSAKSVESKTGTRKRKTSARKAIKKTDAVTLTPEFVEELKGLFEKHNWPGQPIGFVAHPAMASLAAAPCDPGPLTCPGGVTPRQRWVHCPDGTSRLQNYCP
jgi:hypothetical protein